MVASAITLKINVFGYLFHIKITFCLFVCLSGSWELIRKEKDKQSFEFIKKWLWLLSYIRLLGEYNIMFVGPYVNLKGENWLKFEKNKRLFKSKLPSQDLCD